MRLHCKIKTSRTQFFGTRAFLSKPYLMCRVVQMGFSHLPPRPYKQPILGKIIDILLDQTSLYWHHSREEDFITMNIG